MEAALTDDACFQLIFRDITIKGSLLSDASLTKEMCDLVAEKGVECRTKAYDLKDVHKLMVGQTSLNPHHLHVGSSLTMDSPTMPCQATQASLSSM